MSPQEFTDRCIWPDHDPREDELTPDPECQQCGETDREINERGYCSRCAPLWDGDDPNYDPTPMTMGEWDGGFAENH